LIGASLLIPGVGGALVKGGKFLFKGKALAKGAKLLVSGVRSTGLLSPPKQDGMPAPEWISSTGENALFAPLLPPTPTITLPPGSSTFRPVAPRGGNDSLVVPALIGVGVLAVILSRRD
jgi:hypothetical protein